MFVNTPVLLLIFNRPDTTRRVVDALRRVRPEALYIAADGPRRDRPHDQFACEEARSLALTVDWPCQVKTLFRTENLGCRVAVSTAIDWFFENEEAGIILEDDCLPSSSWFPFAAEMLARYRDDERIVCISASHVHGSSHTPTSSYFFSRHNHCWGWASWRRAWQHYDREMAAWPKLRNTEWLTDVGDGSRSFHFYWKDIFDMAYAGKVDSWAYRWTFSCWAKGGLTVLPARNLVSNIGFGADATHTNEGGSWLGSLPLEDLEFPLRHPDSVVRDAEADQWTDRHLYRITPLWLARRELEKIPAIHALFSGASRLIRSRLRQFTGFLGR